MIELSPAVARLKSIEARAVLIGGDNFHGAHIFNATLSPALIVLNTAVEQSLVVPTLAGVIPAEYVAIPSSVFVLVNKPTAQAGLGIVGARFIDATHIGVTFMNDTGSSITPTAAEAYTFLVMW